jgi:hypothetical protein
MNVNKNMPVGLVGCGFVWDELSLLHNFPLQQLTSQLFKIPVLLAVLQNTPDLQRKELEQLRFSCVTVTPAMGSIVNLKTNHFIFK